MPIEIRELTIKVNVNQDKVNKPGAAEGNPAEAAQEEKDALLKQVAEEVLRIIEHKKER